ncbi:MAG: AAC(3) family N-acetyltransferase [Actinomycetota bacterium]|nr:AAC(3) family N-acetyltransferase [Actinomycetota bacterium]
MSEEEVIKRSLNPQTRASLKEGLAEAGVKSGMVLLAHSSLSSIGWVCGKEAALILALEDLLGPDGTLVMPAHSGDLSHPRLWSMPPVPRTVVANHSRNHACFQQRPYPFQGDGESRLNASGNRKRLSRSNHPHYSFCAGENMLNT